MKTKLLKTMRALLVAAGLTAGANVAWAYTVPDGYGVKNVFIGTAGAADANGVITTVTAEDFESTESLGSAWGSGSLWTNLASGTLYLDNITEVAKPEVNAEVSYTMDGENKVYNKPTYVGGKAIVFHNRTNKTTNPYYGTYTFDAVSSGKLVFSGDMYFVTSAGPLHVTFVDSEGNNVIDFHWNNGSGTRAFNYEYTNNEGTPTTGTSSVNYCDYRNYKGYGIRDFVLDLETGNFEFTVDFINTRSANNIIRSQERRTGKIQTGRNIAQMRVGTDAAGTTTVNYYTYLDNVKLYTVAQRYGYTINYKCGDTTIKTADATRTAVWGTNVTLTNADKERIIYDHATYEYASDDASTVTIASDGSSVITVEFAKVPDYTLADVTAAATWDWSVVTSSNAYNQLTDETTPTKSTEFVLKNVELYGKQDGSAYSIPEGFGNAQQLEIIAEYPFRFNSNSGMLQGNSIKFHTTVPGKVKVKFSNTGGSNDRPYRHVSVNGTLSATGSANGTAIESEEFPVEAGDVTITGYIPDASSPAERSGDNVGAAMLRIYKVEFTPYTEVELAINDCKTYETSSDFATYIDAGSYASAAEVYAAHSAWQIAQTKANGSTDYSKAIMNRTFELHNTNGWTIYGDPATGGADSDNNGIVEYGDGWSQYYTGWNGRNVSQNIASLPKGSYRLTAKVYSWSGGAPVRLFANGQLSDAENGDDHDPVLDFTVTGNESSIKIGIGGVGKNNDTDNTWGTWGYRVKNFSLTLLGVPVTVSDAGYATYVNSDYDLDFSSTGIEAYKVKVSNKGVATLTKVGAVPAGTPVLLYKEGGATEPIPVAASAAAVEDNDLVAGTGAAVATTDGNYTNMILNNMEGNVGFYYAAGQTVAANRAYLHIAKELAPDAAASRMTMVFAGEASGIETIKDGQARTSGCYSLSGQRVGQPSKGLYIVDGKKVIMK